MSEKGKHNTFILYKDRMKGYAEELDDAELGSLMRSIIQYEDSGVVTETGNRTIDFMLKDALRWIKENDDAWKKKSQQMSENAKKANKHEEDS